MSASGGTKAIVAALGRQPRHRGHEVRRVPAHRLVVDAGRVDPLGRRLGQPGLLLSAADAPGARRRRSTPSATAASATSTPSSSRSCCSASVACSRCTRAGTSSSTRSRSTPGSGCRSRCCSSPSAWRASRSAPRSWSPTTSAATLPGCSSSAGPRRPSCRSSCWRTSRALVGLVLALFGVGLTLITDDGVWDGIGTVCIGVLLVVIAVVLAIETKSLLLGEGADPGGRGAGSRRRWWPTTGAAHHPHADAAPRAGGAAGRRQDRGGAHRQRGRGRPRDRRRRAADPRGRADRPGDLPRARHRARHHEPVAGAATART